MRKQHNCGHGHKGNIVKKHGITFCGFCGAEKVKGRWENPDHLTMNDMLSGDFG